MLTVRSVLTGVRKDKEVADQEYFVLVLIIIFLAMLINAQSWFTMRKFSRRRHQTHYSIFALCIPLLALGTARLSSDDKLSVAATHINIMSLGSALPICTALSKR